MSITNRKELWAARKAEDVTKAQEILQRVDNFGMFPILLREECGRRLIAGVSPGDLVTFCGYFGQKYSVSENVASIEILNRFLDRKQHGNWRLVSIYDWLDFLFGGVSYEYKQTSTYSVEGIMRKHGKSHEDAEVEVLRRKQETVQTKDNLIRKYGVDLGSQKYERFVQKSRRTRDNFIKERGYAEGVIAYDNKCKTQSYKISKQRYIDENRLEDYVRINKQRGLSQDQLLMKHGAQRAQEIRAGRMSGVIPRSRASKLSLQFLIPIYRRLRRAGVSRDDIMWGIGENKEFSIYTKEIGLRFYDFTILSKKIIVEFNGVRWHPKSPHQDWVGVYGPATQKEIYEKDQRKIRLAEEQGFMVIVLWEDEKYDFGAITQTILEQK